MEEIGLSSESTPLLPIISSEQKITLKKKIISSTFALIASLIFAVNNLLIEQKNLHCSDLLLFRCTLQILIFALLIKLQNISWYPINANSAETRSDYVFDIIYLIFQVSHYKK